jgi:hypothetical protein
MQFDLNMDYAKPTMTAIISQALAQGAAQMAISTAQNSSFFTTTLTVS